MRVFPERINQGRKTHPECAMGCSSVLNKRREFRAGERAQQLSACYASTEEFGSPETHVNSG